MKAFLVTFLLLISNICPPSAVQAFNIDDSFFQSHPDAVNFSGTSLGRMISIILPNLIILAGVFLLILIIYAGYQLIVYGGQYNTPQRVSQAKNLATYAFIGFLIVVCAYFILQLISAVTGINFTSLS
jgi:hypothetical protein